MIEGKREIGDNVMNIKTPQTKGRLWRKSDTK